MDDGRSRRPGRARDRQDDGGVLRGGATDAPRRSIGKTRNLTSIVASAPERQDIRVGGGFLSVVFIRSLDEVPGFIRESDQTITYFGWERGEIEAVAASRVGPGVSRWAPIGTALDFDFIWDGYDIPFELTRLVRVS